RSAGQDDAVVHLLTGPLHAMGKPRNQMVGVLGIDLVDMIEPRSDVARVASDRGRRTVEVERAGAGMSDPAGDVEQAILDQLGLGRVPNHLFYGPLRIEPIGRSHGLVL